MGWGLPSWRGGERHTDNDRLSRSQALTQLHEAAKVLGIVLISSDLHLEGQIALDKLREALGHLEGRWDR